MTSNKELEKRIDELEARVAELELLIKGFQFVFEPLLVEIRGTGNRSVDIGLFGPDDPRWQTFDWSNPGDK